MFKIGDFSKISQTTVKTLHHYDEIGLLKPAEVDPFTGYRRYTIGQLPRLNRILALRDLGFSLEQIARFLDDKLSYEVMCAMMQTKQAELEQRVHDEQVRLARVAIRLRMIQQEETMINYDVRIRPVKSYIVIGMREIMPTIAHMERRISEVMQALEREGIERTGPLMTLFYHKGFREEDLDVEIAVQVEGKRRGEVLFAGGPPLTVRELPAVKQTACLIYQGAYETLSEPYAAIGRWFAEQGYRPGLPGREIYLSGPQDGEVPVTEIQFPIEE